MKIAAIKLKASKTPEPTALYEIAASRNIIVEEEHDDNSMEQVILEYDLKVHEIGYFAKEYRPNGVKKEGSKVIDITAIILNHDEKYIKWHLYDIKRTLAGAETVTKLLNQWYAGLKYVEQTFQAPISQYSTISDLGVITRCYDKKRMERLRDSYLKNCAEMQAHQRQTPLAKRKKQSEIAKVRAVLKASQAILDKKFQIEDSNETYDIHIKIAIHESNEIYKLKFPV